MLPSRLLGAVESTVVPQMGRAAGLYLSQPGKGVRPLLALTMASACNVVSARSNQTSVAPSEAQATVARVAELIHTASLVHDDVVDAAMIRRSGPSVNSLYGIRRAIFAGNFILGRASCQLAQIGNSTVIGLLSKVLDELVRGEFMQLETSLEPRDRFDKYIQKTYKKTASLIARSCEAVAVLSGAPEGIQRSAYEYGRNVGIAFQLIDDMLDFVSSAEVLGKPAAADLKLGLATAPVLYASIGNPALHPLIARRFEQSGDVEQAFRMVQESDGIEKTSILARDYANSAIRSLTALPESTYRNDLEKLARDLLARRK